MMKYAGSDDAKNLGRKAESFTDEVLNLLRTIAENTSAIRAKLEGDENGR